MLSFESLLEVVPTLQCHMEWCMTEQTASRKERCSCMHLSEETWRMFTQKLQSVLKDLTVTSSKSKRCVYVCTYVHTYVHTYVCHAATLHYQCQIVSWFWINWKYDVHIRTYLCTHGEGEKQQ